jgi:hypothetical protein
VIIMQFNREIATLLTPLKLLTIFFSLIQDWFTIYRRNKPWLNVRKREREREREQCAGGVENCPRVQQVFFFFSWTHGLMRDSLNWDLNHFSPGNSKPDIILRVRSPCTNCNQFPHIEKAL